MKFDPKRFPTLCKALALEEEAAKVRSTIEYRRELHLAFPPPYTEAEIEEARKEIEAYREDCGKYCICDGYCHNYPRHAFHIYDHLREYKRQGEQLGL